MPSTCSAGICASACSSDGDLIGGGVRAGVAGPQLAAQRLAGLVRVGQHRVKPVAALERAGRALLLGMAPISVASRSIVSRAGAPASSHDRARARARARRAALQPAGVAGDRVDHPKRRRVRRHRPEQRRLIAHRAPDLPGSRRHRRASPPDRGPRGPDHDRRARRRSPPSCARQRPRQAGLVGRPAASNALPACDTKPSPSDVTSTVKLAPIAHHLQGDPPELGPSAFDKPKNPCSGGQFSGPDLGGAAHCFMNDPG